MGPVAAECRRQAAYCEEMAERALTEEMKADWLRLAAKWLAMLPHKDAVPKDKFEAMVQDKSTRHH